MSAHCVRNVSPAVGPLPRRRRAANQLFILLRKHRAKDLSTFVVVNFGAAILSAAVMVVAMRVKKENRSARGRKAAAHRRDAA